MVRRRRLPLNLSSLYECPIQAESASAEVAGMLQSSNIPADHMVDRLELRSVTMFSSIFHCSKCLSDSEHDLMKEQQAQVLRTAKGTLALPLGRAMFTYSSVPTVTKEVYTIPKIELSIRLVPRIQSSSLNCRLDPVGRVPQWCPSCFAYFVVAKLNW